MNYKWTFNISHLANHNNNNGKHKKNPKKPLHLFSYTVIQVLNVLFVLKMLFVNFLDICFDACSKNAIFNLNSIWNILSDPVATYFKRKSLIIQH